MKYAAIVIVALAVSILAVGVLPQLLVITGLCAGGIYLIRRIVDRDMRRTITILFLATFLLQVLLAIFIYNQTVDTKYCGFSYKGDDYVYGDFGIIAGGLWRQGLFPGFKGLAHYNLIGRNVDLQSYQLYNAFVFYLFGASGGQILLIMNAFFHAFIVVPVYFLCKDLGFRASITGFVIALFLFWPSTFYWSLFNFKEPALLLAIFVTFSLFAAIRKNPNLKNAFYLFISIIVVCGIKKYFNILLPIFLIYMYLLWKWKYKNILVLTSLCALIIFQLKTGRVLPELYNTVPSLPSTIWGVKFYSNITAATYFGNLITNTYPTIILYFPLGVLASLFLPFLLRPYTLGQIVANIETISWWALMPFLIGGIWVSFRAEFKKTAILLSMFFFWSTVLALTQTSMGTLIRQKAIIYYIGFIFIGLAIDRALRKVCGEKL